MFTSVYPHQHLIQSSVVGSSTAKIHLNSISTQIDLPFFFQELYCFESLKNTNYKNVHINTYILILKHDKRRTSKLEVIEVGIYLHVKKLDFANTKEKPNLLNLNEKKFKSEFFSKRKTLFVFNVITIYYAAVLLKMHLNRLRRIM